MQKLVVLLLCFVLSGCLIEEKKYYGCDEDTKCCAGDDDLDVKMPDDASETDAKEKFLDMFEEVTETK